MIDVSGVTVKIMTPMEWSGIPDNPIQRDTERHAKKAMNAHLRFELLTQICVHMARLPNGEEYKVDGHTRSYLWGKGLLSAPDRLLVIVWPVRDMEEMKSFYRSFDEQSAAETVRDKLSGLIKPMGVTFKSSLLNELHFKSALVIAQTFLYGANAAKNMDVEKLVEAWLPELKLLDKAAAPRRPFSTGTIAGALLCLARDEEDALPFWEKFATSKGVLTDDGHDAVFYLKSMAAENGYGGKANMKTAINSLSAYESFLRNGNNLLKKHSGITEKQREDWIIRIKHRKDMRERNKPTLIRRQEFKLVPAA